MATDDTTVFEGRDLADAVFWGVSLRDALVRDADLTGARFQQVRMVDVDIDGSIDRLVVNGVDVTDFVAERDRWAGLRDWWKAEDEPALRDAWGRVETAWTAMFDRVRPLADDVLLTSVDGEWSFRDTVRHLVFAIDKWFTIPILGDETFSPIGLPNSGSADEPWPGVDRDADPSVDEAIAVLRDRFDRYRTTVDSLDLSALPAETEIRENGLEPTLMCFQVVLEELFEHLRYATRDLDVLTT